jgi:hypothetical protein
LTALALGGPACAAFAITGGRVPRREWRAVVDVALDCDRSTNTGFDHARDFDDAVTFVHAHLDAIPDCDR